MKRGKYFPVEFHPRLRSKAIDAWCDKVDGGKRQGNLETVSLVTTDQEWSSFYRYGAEGASPLRGRVWSRQMSNTTRTKMMRNYDCVESKYKSFSFLIA